MAPDLRQTLTTFLPRLRRFGLALTGSSADADDLVQTTCERALRHADQLRDVPRMDAWLYGIMRNLWIDEVRHRRIRRHDDIETAFGVVGEDGQAITDSRINLAAVRRAMAEMAPDQRAVLMLVCVDGLSYREAADVLGVPIGTVMSRLSRARQDLHTRLTVRVGSDTVTPFPMKSTQSNRDRTRPA